MPTLRTTPLSAALRQEHLARLRAATAENPLDILVVGGGSTGVGAAFDAATRGLDVGSIEFIHSQIVAKRDEGVAVLLVSAELDEVLALADTVGVLYRGSVVATMPRAEATRERLGILMAGGDDPGPPPPGGEEIVEELV